MNLADYLDQPEVIPMAVGLPKGESLYGKIQMLKVGKEPRIDSNTLFILGVNESRNSSNPGAALSANIIRKYLYSLSGSEVKFPLVDLGNLKPTGSPSDTYIALNDVVSHIVRKGATCIILGGTQELTHSLYKAVSELYKPANISILDNTIDMGSDDGDFSSTCYIEKFIDDPPSKLFSLSLLGIQRYLTNSQHISILQERNHEVYRLGYLRSSMVEVEPTLRDSNIVSIDMGCVRQCDSPGALNPSPNGLYAEELCQLARYSGLSSRVNVFGFFDLNTHSDPNGQSSHLAAQAAWHFIEAFAMRSRYAFSPTDKSIKRFYVKSPIPNIDMVFLKNSINDTWWMEFTHAKTGKSTVTSCSFNDYKKASIGDVPDRWMRAWKKMI